MQRRRLRFQGDAISKHKNTLSSRNNGIDSVASGVHVFIRRRDKTPMPEKLNCYGVLSTNPFSEITRFFEILLGIFILLRFERKASTLKLTYSEDKTNCPSHFD